MESPGRAPGLLSSPRRTPRSSHRAWCPCRRSVMGLDAAVKTRYRRCARFRHLSVAVSVSIANSRKSFSRFLSRRCHGDGRRAHGRMPDACHDRIASRHRRRTDVYRAV